MVPCISSLKKLERPMVYGPLLKGFTRGKSDLIYHAYASSTKMFGLTKRAVTDIKKDICVTKLIYTFYT